MNKNNIAKKICDMDFTSQELACAELLVKHISVKKIAKKLNVPLDTVNLYISSMQKKTGCNTKIEMIEWLFES